jgi:lipoprotein-releasing system permease protein
MIGWIARRWSRAGLGNMALSTVRIAALSMFIGTLVMVLALSVVRGFRQAIRGRAALFVGDLVVQKYTGSAEQMPLMEADSLVEKNLRLLPGVTAVNATLVRPAILKTLEGLTGVLVKGVDASYEGWNVFPRPEPGTLVLSRTLARKLAVDSGSTLKVYFLTPDSLGGLTLRLPRTFTVRQLYHTGLQEFDEYLALAYMDDLRTVFCNENRPCLTSYEIYCQPGVQDELKEMLQGLFPPDISVMTTRDVLPNLYEWLDYLDVNIYIITVLILVVGLLSMTAAFLTMTLERVNSIGLLRALGMPAGRISLALGLQFSVVLGASLAAGDILGWLLGWLQKKFSLIPLDADTYYLDTVPVAWDWPGVLAVNALSVALALVAMAGPALYIRRLSLSRLMRLD